MINILKYGCGFLALIWVIGAIGLAVQSATDSPLEAAQREARACLKTWQWKYLEQGYAKDMVNLGAILKCKDELRRVEDLTK